MHFYKRGGTETRKASECIKTPFPEGCGSQQVWYCPLGEANGNCWAKEHLVSPLTVEIKAFSGQGPEMPEALQCSGQSFTMKNCPDISHDFHIFHWTFMKLKAHFIISWAKNLNFILHVEIFQRFQYTLSFLGRPLTLHIKKRPNLAVAVVRIFAKKIHRDTHVTDTTTTCVVVDRCSCKDMKNPCPPEVGKREKKKVTTLLWTDSPLVAYSQGFENEVLCLVVVIVVFCLQTSVSINFSWWLARQINYPWTKQINLKKCLWINTLEKNIIPYNDFFHSLPTYKLLTYYLAFLPFCLHWFFNTCLSLSFIIHLFTQATNI